MCQVPIIGCMLSARKLGWIQRELLKLVGEQRICYRFDSQRCGNCNRVTVDNVWNRGVGSPIPVGDSEIGAGSHVLRSNRCRISCGDGLAMSSQYLLKWVRCVSSESVRKLLTSNPARYGRCHVGKSTESGPISDVKSIFRSISPLTVGTVTNQGSVISARNIIPLY